jgi:NTE family protein
MRAHFSRQAAGLFLIGIVSATTNGVNAEQLHKATLTQLEATDAPATPVTARKTVTLCIGGGAIKSVSALGVLRVLKNANIPIDYIYGTSAGAAVGSLYAAGVPIDEIERIFVSGQWQHTVSNHLLYKAVWSPMYNAVSIGAHNHFPGVLEGAPYEKLLHKYLPKTFAELKIPFRAVATDLCSGLAVVVKTGDVTRAVLASCSLPLALKPVEFENKLLVDGGVAANLPATCAKADGEADVIISVYTDGSIRARDKSYFSSFARIQRRTVDLFCAQADIQSAKNSDVLIVPDIDDIPIMTTDKRKVRESIEAGAKAASDMLPAICAKLGLPEPAANK